MTTLIINIKILAGAGDEYSLKRGAALARLPCIKNAFLLVEQDVIAAYGAMYELELMVPNLPKHIIDATGQVILPCWCDSHTHIVFTGSRETEFVDKLKGLSYAEIAARGGGILNSSALLNQVSEDQLYKESYERLINLTRLGTGAIEIKSGYGLTVEGELKMLRVIKRLKEQTGMLIKSSFLAAHTYPQVYKENHEGYIQLIIEQMLPAVAEEKLADYIDVFCETGFFSPSEMETICKAAAAYGIRTRLHTNQLNSIGGLQKGIELNAISLDHLEVMTEKDIQDLAQSSSIGTLLPTAAFFLRMPMQPARALIDANAAIALASDFNPGSSPSGNMNFVIALSCIQMKMLPAEAIQAATINGAYAMEVQKQAGTISTGKFANLIFTKPIPSLEYLPYAFSTNLIDKVMIKGEWA